MAKDWKEKVYQKAELMLNRTLTEKERLMLLEMCDCAGEELEGRLRAGVDPDDIESTFVKAAGILALSLYIQLWEGDQGVSNLKLGDVSLQRRSAGEARVSASSLRQCAEGMLGAWLEDRGFAFYGVRG